MTSTPLANIPWEERPSGCRRCLALQRQSDYPRDAIPSSNSIFNTRGRSIPGRLCRCIPLRQ